MGGVSRPRGFQALSMKELVESVWAALLAFCGNFASALAQSGFRESLCSLPVLFLCTLKSRHPQIEESESESTEPTSEPAAPAPERGQSIGPLEAHHPQDQSDTNPTCQRGESLKPTSTHHPQDQSDTNPTCQRGESLKPTSTHDPQDQS